jgi:hypothetical protein
MRADTRIDPIRARTQYLASDNIFRISKIGAARGGSYRAVRMNRLGVAACVRCVLLQPKGCPPPAGAADTVRRPPSDVAVPRSLTRHHRVAAGTRQPLEPVVVSRVPQPRSALPLLPAAPLGHRRHRTQPGRDCTQRHVRTACVAAAEAAPDSHQSRRQHSSTVPRRPSQAYRPHHWDISARAQDVVTLRPATCPAAVGTVAGFCLGCRVGNRASARTSRPDQQQRDHRGAQPPARHPGHELRPVNRSGES